MRASFLNGSKAGYIIVTEEGLRWIPQDASFKGYAAHLAVEEYILTLIREVVFSLA